MAGEAVVVDEVDLAAVGEEVGGVGDQVIGVEEVVGGVEVEERLEVSTSYPVRIKEKWRGGQEWDQRRRGRSD